MEFKLKELGSLKNGKRVDAQDAGKYPVYGANGIVGYHSESITTGTTIVIGRVGANCGTVMFSEDPAWLTDNTIAFQPNGNVHNYYIYQLLKSMNLNRFATGSAQPLLNQNALNSFTLNLPSMDIQEKVGEFLYKLDEKILLNNNLIANLEELSQTLFKRWFVDFEFPDENGNPYKSSGGQLTDSELGFIPQGWSIRTIDQVAEFINGYAFKSKDLIKINPGNYLHVFKMGHIKRGGGLKHDGTKDYYPKDIPEKLNKYILKRGDILMSMTDMKSNVAILGHTALMDQDDKYIVNQRVGLLRILDKAILDYPYLYILTNTSEFINELRKKANSGVQVNLSSAVIKKEPIILPPAEVHKEFNDIAKNYYQQIFNLSRENEHLKTLRDILLPKLMSGEIELPDELEADEHAELLQ